MRRATLPWVYPSKRSACLGVVGLLWACVPEDRPADPGPDTGAKRVEAASATPRFRVVPRPRASGSVSHSARVPSSAVEATPLVRPFIDDFERGRLGRNYRATGPGWQVQAGRLCGQETKNHPVWLLRRLPPNVRIEFDAMSESAEGDIKAEVFGDGRSFAHHSSYSDATSYLMIYGGWKNSRHVLARLDEHAPDRLERLIGAEHTSAGGEAVVPGRTYRFKVERSGGNLLSWSVDGVEIHRLKDPAPLVGPGHEYFAFNAWRARVCFDNLKLVSLGN